MSELLQKGLKEAVGIELEGRDTTVSVREIVAQFIYEVERDFPCDEFVARALAKLSASHLEEVLR